eukprot:scaffold27284_cov19-Tisochrysis_lutea.AAC.1
MCWRADAGSMDRDTGSASEGRGPKLAWRLAKDFNVLLPFLGRAVQNMEALGQSKDHRSLRASPPICIDCQPPWQMEQVPKDGLVLLKFHLHYTSFGCFGITTFSMVTWAKRDAYSPKALS